MNTQSEIKAGQRWKNKKDGRIINVIFTDKRCTLFDSDDGARGIFNGSHLVDFYRLIPEPETRPITKDDIMKMLAVNPTVYRCHKISSEWNMLTAPLVWLSDEEKYLGEYQFSHNPFAQNPVIIGPMVPDEVGQ